MLSTAILEAAQARTFDPRLTSCKMISTTVVVFPVPGGPCSKKRSLDERAFEIASFLKDKRTHLVSNLCKRNSNEKACYTLQTYIQY